MIIKITCPSCAHKFIIEPTASMREIESMKYEMAFLKKENADLRKHIAKTEGISRNGSDPLEIIKKAMGL